MSWAGVGGRNFYYTDLTSKASQNVAGSIQAPNLHEFPLQTLHRSIFITQTAGPAPLNERFSHPSPKALLKLKKKKEQKTQATQNRGEKKKEPERLLVVGSVWRCPSSGWCGDLKALQILNWKRGALTAADPNVSPKRFPKLSLEFSNEFPAAFFPRINPLHLAAAVLGPRRDRTKLPGVWWPGNEVPRGCG